MKTLSNPFNKNLRLNNRHRLHFLYRLKFDKWNGCFSSLVQCIVIIIIIIIIIITCYTLVSIDNMLNIESSKE